MLFFLIYDVQIKIRYDMKKYKNMFIAYRRKNSVNKHAPKVLKSPQKIKSISSGWMGVPKNLPLFLMEKSSPHKS